MKKFLKTLGLLMSIPFALTACEPGTLTSKEEFAKAAAKVEEQEAKSFTSIEVKYEFKSSASGYYKELLGEDANSSENGQLVFTFRSNSWVANKNANNDEINDVVEEILDVKASVYAREVEAEYAGKVKYYVNPLGVGVESSASQNASGVTVSSKLEMRCVFNDFGLVSSERVEMKTSSKGSVKSGTTTVNMNGDWNLFVKCEFSYK